MLFTQKKHTFICICLQSSLALINMVDVLTYRCNGPKRRLCIYMSKRASMCPGFCGELWDFFQDVNVPMHWKHFAIEIAPKMATPLISALTAELGRSLRSTLRIIQSGPRLASISFRGSVESVSPIWNILSHFGANYGKVCVWLCE